MRKISHKSKKGLSTVVTTLIIILLVFIAVGIVWVVIRNVLDTTSTEIDIRSKCQGAMFTVTDSNCTSATCTYTIERAGGGQEVSGVRVILSNGTDSVETTILAADVNILNSGTITPGLVAPITDKKVSAYFTIDGADNFC